MLDPAKNVVLIGFMGTGKTSVGKVLARRLGRQVVDVDEFIEASQGRRISELFKEEGEDYFRTVEKSAVEEIAKNRGLVITTGGGVVLNPENSIRLRANGILIALFASPETIYQRVKNSKHRPLLDQDNPLAAIHQLLPQRLEFYKKADYQFDTDGKTPTEVAHQILRVLV